MKFPTLIRGGAGLYHNFPPYLLSDIDDLSDLLLCELSRSNFVTNPTNSLAVRGFVVSHTANVPRNPLRSITARTPVFLDLYNSGTEKLAYYVDTLICGHQQMVFDFDSPDTGHKRHRCAECAQAAALPQKKSVQSVPAEKKEEAA